MSKEEILKEISNSLDTESGNKGRNSMGVSESYFNPYYLIGSCFTREQLMEMSELELSNIKKIAEFASETFY
jgi:hypothetical protein